MEGCGVKTENDRWVEEQGYYTEKVIFPSETIAPPVLKALNSELYTGLYSKLYAINLYN